MTNSPPTEVGGFSRKPLNLNCLVITNSQEAVAKYIAEQDGKDVFEYTIFQGQTKIGDFSGN